MTPAAIAALAIDAMLTLVVTITSGMLLYLVKRRGDREQGRDRLLTELASDMRSLREGMSLGAREAIGRIAGRLDTVESAHEELAAKVITFGGQLTAVDRIVEGHIRTPSTHAHPPPGFGVPAG